MVSLFVVYGGSYRVKIDEFIYLNNKDELDEKIC